jgi:hypothetical protein
MENTIDISKYPIRLLEELSTLYKGVKNVVLFNSSFIQFHHDKPDNFVIKANNFEFYFSFRSPHLDDKRKANIGVEWNPKNELSLQKYGANVEFGQAISFFDNWLNIVKKYSLPYFSDEDKILQEYEQEEYIQFEFTSDSDDTLDKPLSYQKQVQLFKLLEEFKVHLQHKPDIATEELIVEASTLQESIPNLTKRQTRLQVSKFLAKFRKSSFKAFKEFVEASKKEAFKMIFKVLTDGVGNLLP